MGIARLLRLKEVVHVTGQSKTSIYRKMAAKEFPQPVRVGSQTVAWRETDLEQWITSLPVNSGRLE